MYRDFTIYAGCSIKAESVGSTGPQKSLGAAGNTSLRRRQVLLPLVHISAAQYSLLIFTFLCLWHLFPGNQKQLHNMCVDSVSFARIKSARSCSR